MLALTVMDMLNIHLLPISIHTTEKLSLKFTIEFVGPNVSSTNPIINLKMIWIEDEFVSFSFSKPLVSDYSELFWY